MKPPALSLFAAILLSTFACSKAVEPRAREPAALGPPPTLTIPEVARAPDTAPPAAEADPAPSPAEVAAFHAPVPK